MARIGRTFGGVLAFSVLGVASGQALGDDDQILEERLAECARKQDGECFLQLAAFEEAAAAFEERSAWEAKEQGTILTGGDLLAAMRLRRVLGQPQRAHADAENLLRDDYSFWQRSELAEEVFRLAEVFESAGDQAKADAHYRAYLRDFGKQGGWDRFLVAHAELGARLMKRSCPIAGYLGTCVELTRERRLCPDDRDAWGNVPRPMYAKKVDAFWRESAKRHKRDPRLLREAMAHLRMVVDSGPAFLAEQDAGKSPERMRVWANAYSEATTLLAAEDLDAFLAMGIVPEDLKWDMPTQLDGPCEAERKQAAYEESQRRWLRWLGKKVSRLTKLWATYRAAIARGGPEAAVVAAGHFALVTSHWENAMWSTADVECYPEAHRDPDREFSPLFDNAAVAAQSCHELAAVFGIDGLWATYCRLEAERRWEMRFGWRTAHVGNIRHRFRHPTAKVVDWIHEVSPSEVFMTHVRDGDANVAAAEISTLNTPAKAHPKQRKKPCREGTGKRPRPLQMLEFDGSEFAPAFGRVVPFPEDFPTDLAKRFGVFPAPPAQRREGARNER